MELSIRQGENSDLLAVLDFWREADLEPTHTDEVEGLRVLVDSAPGSMLLAEVDGRLVGTVIAAWDGWRGSIYRLAVLPTERHKGLGRHLIEEAERRLTGLGARRLQAIVVQTDSRAMGFWRSSGWDEQDQRRRFVKECPVPESG